MEPIYAFAGDTAFTHSNTLLGRLIRWGETDPGETNGTWANHQLVVVESGWIIPPEGDPGAPLAITIEALQKVEKTEWWTRHKAEVAKGYGIRVFGPGEPLTPEEVEVFQFKANQFVGDKYGYWKLGIILADRLVFKGKKVLAPLMFVESRPICSFLAGMVCASVNRFFGVAPQAVDPDEAMDYCLAHPLGTRRQPNEPFFSTWIERARQADALCVRM